MVKPDWTDVESYTQPVPPDVPKPTPQQAAIELFRRRQESHDERMAERMALLSERALRLQAMEQQLWEASMQMPELIAATCAPSRAERLLLGQPRGAWLLWAFVMAPVVIGVLGIALGLALR